MKLISLVLTYLGAILLVVSMYPTKKLCDRKHHATRAWRFLGIFIIMFIVGYGMFSVFLINNEMRPIFLFIAVILFGGGIFVYAVVKLAQISIDKLSLMAEDARHRSMHDELTGLPNQNYFNNKVDAAIKKANNIKQPLVVFLLDINRFKEINSAIGHFYADFLLQKVADRIRRSIRNPDILARWGGDKFAVLLPDTDLKRAIAIANNITDNLAEPFNIEGNSISVEISNGIAVYPEHGDQTDKLMHNAQIAMSDAQLNHVSYSLFDPDQHYSPFKKLIMASELRDAINKDELDLYFQPQISVINGRLSGVEALIRWHHPEKGTITPVSFMDVIEHTDLNKTLAVWVLNTALRHHKEWLQSGLDINISVNLSIKNLHDYEFPNDLKNILDKWRIAPNRLTLEITESGLMVDPGRVTKVVTELKRTGVNLSIDDFGTGYSSLAYLRKFPAREIKIDKSFVLDMLVNEDSAIIVKSTIDLAHNIGRLVVAEGVENRETYTLLKRLGCDFLQGFYFSKALPADELLEWHDQYRKSLDRKKS
ncbi:MAG: EAL domain-containing protein [Desulfobulbales bacterium]|nr:EAL domain-containing protein [Desulfobulbales bacterium]